MFLITTNRDNLESVQGKQSTTIMIWHKTNNKYTPWKMVKQQKRLKQKKRGGKEFTWARPTNHTPGRVTTQESPLPEFDQLAGHNAPRSNRLKTAPNHHTTPFTCALLGCASGQSGMILARRQIQLLILSRLLRSTSLCVTLRFSSLVVPVRRWLIMLSLVLGVRLRGAVLVRTSLMT